MKQQILNIILLIGLISFSSCMDENEFKQNNTLPDAPEGFVNIEFDLNSGAFHKPETKAIRSDADFDAPWVLSFKLQNQGTPNPDTLFVEAVKTEIAGSKYFMQLSGSKEPHLLYFVANADKVIENKKSLFPTKKFGQIMSLLTFGNPSPDANFGLGPLSNPQGSVPFTNQHIPMTATAQLDQIVKGTKVAGTVNLQRIVSKIYLNATKTNQKDGFVLTGLTVIDVPSRGYMNNKIDIRSVQPQDIIDYGRKTGADRLTTLVLENIEGNTTLSSSTDRPIYVYPFLENDSRGGVYQVIFSGHFGDNKTKYFKIKLGGLNNPVALNKPNTSFLINIESIQNSGYVSLEHALQYEPSTGVVTKVTLLDPSHEIVANGQYYMGVSNSVFKYIYNGRLNNNRRLCIATITTNYFNQPNAVQGTIEVVAGSIRLLTQQITSNQTDVICEIGTYTKGTIRVTLGNLTKDLEIKTSGSAEFGNPISAVRNYNNNRSGILLGENIKYAYIERSSNAESGLSTTVKGNERKQEITSGGSIYLFANVGLQHSDIDVRMTGEDGRIWMVKQQAYLPEFAGNNLYINEAGKPAFDDMWTARANGTVRYQGVFTYGYGNLILHKSGDSHSSGMIYSASGKVYTGTDVPMLAVSSQGPAPIYSWPMNASADLGDICEFMTRRGSAPGSKNGKKWKLPSWTDYEYLAYNTLATGSYYQHQNTGIPSNGKGLIESFQYMDDYVYFPASGYYNIGLGNGSFVNQTSHYIIRYLQDNNGVSIGGVTIDRDRVLYGTSFPWPEPRNSGSIRCVVDTTKTPIIPLYQIKYDLTPEPNETIGNQTSEVQLAKFVDRGDSFTLSNTKLTTTEAGEHTGWIVNGREYALGTTISGINSDLVIKPKWEYIKLAGSNIYWDGTKLTFDDVPTTGYTPHAQYQGVYFRWGSLVAFMITDKNKPIINYSPNNIDYPSIPDIPYISKGFGDAPAVNIMLQEHNLSASIGDICKYMTDKGWTPPGKWQVPTADQLKTLTDRRYHKIGNWDYMNFNNLHGTMTIPNGAQLYPIYIPASGHISSLYSESINRPGSYVTFNVSSQRGVGFEPNSMFSAAGGTFSITWVNRSEAAPVRCIRVD